MRESSEDLKKFIESGKKIIITTVQKFPVIYQAMGDEHRSRSFALIIDEAHSSQGGKTSAKMNVALGETTSTDEEETIEDKINRVMESRKMLTNASYFAFTATPKNKTLQLFGEPMPAVDGKTPHRPFHSYTMKQAIEERFILDVLKSYTPVTSFYKLVKTVESDPEFDTGKARKKLRKYVESHDHAISIKAEIMVDHFQEQVLALNKIGGQARAMVVTTGIERAIQYFHAIRDYLREDCVGVQAETNINTSLLLHEALRTTAQGHQAGSSRSIRLGSAVSRSRRRRAAHLAGQSQLWGGRTRPGRLRRRGRPHTSACSEGFSFPEFARRSDTLLLITPWPWPWRARPDW